MSKQVIKEFGSDFHYIECKTVTRNLPDYFNEGLLLATGRQCIIALIIQYQWKRMWFPSYFCQDVIKSIQLKTRIEVMFYNDHPLIAQPNVSQLPFKAGDSILVVNYFGHRKIKTPSNIPVPVIEDHTHDLLGKWALNSEAEWCVASLRKTLPIAEGGLVWSPKGHRLNIDIHDTKGNEKVANNRWSAMHRKTEYLLGKPIEKLSFLSTFSVTEEALGNINLSFVDTQTRAFISGFDIYKWYRDKKDNYNLLRSLVDKNIVLSSGDSSFSLILLAKSNEVRNRWKEELIHRSIYPAILWDCCHSGFTDSNIISKRILSIHCDARYDKEDIVYIANAINSITR